MSRIAVIPAAGAAMLALLAGCGGGDGAGGAARAATTAARGGASTSAATAAAAPAGSLVKVRPTRYGRILVDHRGQALYLFTKDRPASSRCYGECASAWPPLYTRGRPVAGRDVAAARLGTVRRGNGRLQVTYAGRPLYYYSSDTPTQILCQNVREFGGLWLVVKPTGAPVR